MKLIRSSRTLLISLGAWLLIAAGLALALFGLLLDYILLGSQPGIGLPQILVVAAGAGLAMFGWRLRHYKPPPDLRANLSKATVITVITFVCIEAALTIGGSATYFHDNRQTNEVVWLRLRRCGAEACSYDYERMQEACQRGVMTERYCAINRAGYRDDDEFVQPGTDITERILLLGDSFTHGFIADVGYAFAEQLDAQLPDALVWNTGITGNGTNSALAAFRVYAPLLQPHLTILGFYASNDFVDNQFPTDVWAYAHNPSGQDQSVRRYALDRLNNPVKLDIDTAFRYHRQEYPAPTSDVEFALGSTRLGTLLLRGLDALSPVLVGQKWQARVDRTRDLLQKLRDEAAQQGSAMLTLLVPSRKDVDWQSYEYLMARKLLTELGMPYMEVIDTLTDEQHYHPTDAHWNNSGHMKVGALLADCIEDFFAAGSLSACDRVIIPGSGGIGDL